MGPIETAEYFSTDYLQELPPLEQEGKSVLFWKSLKWLKWK